MPDPVTLAPPAPAAPAAEPTLEEELEALRPPPEPKAALGGEPPPAPAAEPSAAAAVDLDAKLAAITEPPAAPEPKLTDEQREIVAAIPNVETARQLRSLADGYANFTNTFASGNFEAAEQMLQEWNPDAHAAFEEHIYQKKVASGEWVDRWIAEKEGTAPVHQGMKSLQNQIRDLQSQLANQQQAKQREEQQAVSGRHATALVQHLTGLFDRIEFSPADRRWVSADIYAKISSNEAVRAGINSGHPEAVNKIFKVAVKEYVERDQAAAKGRAETEAALGKHKPLPQTAPVTASALPDNIDDVPKGKEEEWMDEQLAALGKKK